MELPIEGFHHFNDFLHIRKTKENKNLKRKREFEGHKNQIQEKLAGKRKCLITPKKDETKKEKKKAMRIIKDNCFSIYR